MSDINEKKEPLNKNNKVPKLRFTSFNDPWKKFYLHEISTKIKKKNTKLEVTLVLSNSATNGIISQNDYFDKDIANDENIDKYYVISKDDFVYNPRKSLNAPYGPINILEKYDKGIVSPLYTCFSIKADKQEFLKYYFKSNKWHRFIYINGDKGARGDRVSIKDDVFYKMPIMIPNYLESAKISNLLSLLERKIAIARSKYETLKKYKKGLIKSLSKESAQLIKIKDIVNICDKTGLQSSNGKDIGKYVFFINSTNDEFKRTDTYTFDGEYLVLNTGGQAFTSYINGKFSAMSDCLIMKPKRNAMSLFLWLKANEEKINAIGFQGTGLKHLDQSWLFRQNITLSKFSEEILFNLMGATNILIEKQKIRLDILGSVKQYLLSNLFI